MGNVASSPSTTTKLHQTHVYSWKLKETEPPSAVSNSSCIKTTLPRPPRTSDLSAPVTTKWDTHIRTPRSTESLTASWRRAVTSPSTTALVAFPSTELSSTMRTLTAATTNAGC